jgi:hypothetical protein
MSALTFFTRPPLFCMRCGAAVAQDVDKAERIVWCADSNCTQFMRKARALDEVVTLLEAPTDVMVFDPNGRC